MRRQPQAITYWNDYWEHLAKCNDCNDNVDCPTAAKLYDDYLKAEKREVSDTFCAMTAVQRIRASTKPPRNLFELEDLDPSCPSPNKYGYYCAQMAAPCIYRSEADK